MKRVFIATVAVSIVGVMLMIGMSAARFMRQVNHRRLNNELFYAVLRNDTTAVHSLLHEGASVNATPTLSSGRDIFQNLLSTFRHSPSYTVTYPTPLEMATSPKGGSKNPWAMIAGPQIVKALVEAGANPNVKQIGDYTPLGEATAAEDVKSVEALVGHGADVNGRSVHGVAPLHLATTDQIAAILLHHGADVNAKTEDGLTPLSYAIDYGDVTIVKDLLRHGATPNVREQDGVTPLIDACSSGDLPPVRALLAAGADPTLKTKDGYTALDYEEYYGSKSHPNDYREIVRLLGQRR